MDAQVRPFVQILEKLHKDIFEVVAPLTDHEVNWAHPRLSNTIGILLRHVAGSERYWIAEVAGGGKVIRDRDAEFGREPLRKEQEVARLQAAYEEVRTVLESLRAGDLAREVTFGPHDKRRTETASWALLHSLAHTSYHLGQIQLLRKMAEARE